MVHKWLTSELDRVRAEFRDGSRDNLEYIACGVSKPGDVVTWLSVRGQAYKLKLQKVGKPRNNARNWTEADLETVAENYGRMSDKSLAARVGRTECSIRLAAKRRLSINRKMNIYTSREVGKMLGVPCSKAVIFWMQKGWLHGKKASWCQGGNRVWWFEHEDIEAFVRAYPWLPHLERMENHEYLKPIILEAYQKDPWYTAEEAAAYLGLADHNPIHRYIHWGMLPAIRRPGSTSQGLCYLIRKSDLDRLQASPEREKHRKQASSAHWKKRRRDWFKAGRPVHVYSVWRLRCPVCGRPVRVRVDKTVPAPRVKTAFARLYIADTGCFHGKRVTITVSARK